MNPKYETWIQDNYPTHKEAMGQCKEACLKMGRAFQELTVTHGFVLLLGIPASYQHWWCKTPEGTIVDPTAIQYIWNGTPIVDYEEIDDLHPARKYPYVKCAECGEYFYLTEDKKDCSPCCTMNCCKEFMRMFE